MCTERSPGSSQCCSHTLPEWPQEALELFCCSSVLLLLCSAVPLFFCSAVLLFHCSSVLLFLYAAVPLFCCSSVVLFLCVAVPLFCCSSILLSECSGRCSTTHHYQQKYSEGRLTMVINVRFMIMVMRTINDQDDYYNNNDNGSKRINV